MSIREKYPPNYDESDVPDCTLPDPLIDSSGKTVTAASWLARRDELLALFREHIYGTPPTQSPTFDLTEVRRVPLGTVGGSERVDLELRFGDGRVLVRFVIFLPPPDRRPAPTFVGLNFHGNHTVHPDRSIDLPTSWMRDNKERGVSGNKASDVSRGLSAPAWPVEMITARGHAVATAYYGDIDPDFHDEFENGIHALEEGSRSETSGGSIAAWGWGLSRLFDALEQCPEVDAKRVAVIGHSRLGKTALWAAAEDTRFAMAISNNSGCLGAALSRRRFGECFSHITDSFPHWFCKRCDEYVEREDQLPVDQHMLLALIAPRPVCVGSAVEDRWADPKGEFLSCAAADPVYTLLGTGGLGTEEMPEPNKQVGNTIGYHVRPGAHALTPADWWHYLAFADRVMT